MARHSQPNFVSFGADGQAQALFPGGILIPAEQSALGFDPANAESVRFFRTDGTVVSQIYTTAPDGDTGVGLILAGVDRTTGFPNPALTLFTDKAGGHCRIDANADIFPTLPAPGARTIMDEHGRSSYLQFQENSTHYSISNVESVHFAAASQSVAVNIPLPDVAGGTGVFVGAVATCNSFAGGRRIFAHINNGGTFGQIVAFADAAFTGDVDIAYIIWYDD